MSVLWDAHRNPRPSAVRTITFKSKTVGNEHLPCDCHQVSLAENQQRPADCVPDEIRSHLKEIRLEHRSFLLKTEWIYICSSRKHFERLLSPRRPIALSNIFIATLGYLNWAVLWTHLQSLFPPASEGIERSQNLSTQVRLLLSHFHPFIKNLWMSGEVWDTAAWTSRNSIWV